MSNNELNNLLKNSNPNELMSKLNGEQLALFNALMKDGEAREKFLSSPDAQKLLKMLNKG